MTNAQLAQAFEEIADFLAIDDANPFRVRAYRKAADLSAQAAEPLAALTAEQLAALPGIGKDLAQKIRVLVDTGSLPLLNDLRERFGPELRGLLAVRGLGPKRLAQLHDALGVRTLADLQAVLATGRVADMDGFGEALVVRLAEAAAHAEAHSRRALWSAAEAQLLPLIDHLSAVGGVSRLTPAGSFRRGRDTVGDLDLLAISDAPEAVLAAFHAYRPLEAVEGAGPTKSTGHLASGLQVDLRIVPAESFGAALLYFTGSKAHNVALRSRAQKAGLRLNEYGLWDGDRAVAGADEEGLYAALGLAWVPPALREDRGELAWAEAGTLPALLEEDDLAGDLHTHSTWSDGKDALEAMVATAAARGDRYFAVTDHSPLLGMVNGLDAARLTAQAAELEALRTRFPDVRLLHGCEVDIRRDGSLDLPDEALARLDIRVVSVHTHLDLSADEQTARLLRAFANPYVQIWGHPTSRLLLRREGIAFDREAVLDAIAAQGIALEVNAQPDRLDADDVLIRAARERDIPLVISTDAHATAHLAHRRHGVRQARRAAVAADAVLNTREPDLLTEGLRTA